MTVTEKKKTVKFEMNQKELESLHEALKPLNLKSLQLTNNWAKIIKKQINRLQK